jgi:hypothetical protein
MNYHAGFALCALCLLAPTGAAQTNTVSIVGGRSGELIVSLTPVVRLGSAITRAPYYAEEEDEQVKTLADGTQTTQTSPRRKTWRDSQGRVRTEREFLFERRASLPDRVKLIEIDDPVERVRYVLDMARKVAYRTRATLPPPRPAATRSSAEQTAASAIKSMPVPVAPASAATSRLAGDPGVPRTAKQNLGTQLIEGVAAEGSRLTITYPIGTDRYDRPVVTTQETWTSPDLHITVLTKSSDPRSGDYTTRVTHLVRAEPEPSVFLPPPDYEIQNEPRSRRVTIGALPPSKP